MGHARGRPLKYLLDTNVFSEFKRPRGDPRVLARVLATPPGDKFVSAVTIGEITAGIFRLPGGARRRDLEKWLAEVELEFATRILSVDVEVARRWGELTSRAATAGRVIPPADGLIAATALRHGLHLMTRNVADFQPTGVLLIDPWLP